VRPGACTPAPAPPSDPGVEEALAGLDLGLAYLLGLGARLSVLELLLEDVRFSLACCSSSVSTSSMTSESVLPVAISFSIALCETFSSSKTT
jgi:hypothetical protein